MTQTNLSTKQKETHRDREQTCGCQGEGFRGGMEWEVGVSWWKLLYMEWINNKVIIYSTESYMGKNIKKECIYIYVLLNHFAVQEKLTQHCKLTILQ